MALTAIVLGSGAGGGYPQWNCRCAVCRLAWSGDERVSARTQTGLAISGDGRSWVLINAAPELRAQLSATPELHPADGLRGSPIGGAILTGAEVDQVAGLLTLRERTPFDLWATSATLATLGANPIFEVLARDVVQRRTVSLGTPIPLPGGLVAEAFAVAGKVPLYLEESAATLAASPDGTIGIEITGGGRRLTFVPGAAIVDDALVGRLARSDVVLFDGTLFTDDEMKNAGVGEKSGRRMGHMPIDGADGSLAALRSLRARRIYIHINNTNPILVAGSTERRKVEAEGWEVAHDGLRIAL